MTYMRTPRPDKARCQPVGPLCHGHAETCFRWPLLARFRSVIACKHEYLEISQAIPSHPPGFLRGYRVLLLLTRTPYLALPFMTELGFPDSGYLTEPMKRMTRFAYRVSNSHDISPRSSLRPLYSRGLDSIDTPELLDNYHLLPPTASSQCVHQRFEQSLLELFLVHSATLVKTILSIST